MKTLQYKIIKTKQQYNQYCTELKNLVILKKKNQQQQDTVDLLTLLIEKWDDEHNTFKDADPIELLRYLMDENKLKSKDLAELLFVSTSLISDILNYRRGLSKEIIRKMSERFKVSQELFNRPYKIISSANTHLKNVSVMNTRKNVSDAQ
jgi:HTH-type transcriptional regulator/antitoxin HigA